MDSIDPYLHRVRDGFGEVVVVAPDAPAETVEQLRKDYGFDKPLPIQYLMWLKRAVIGDLGVSIATGRPVAGALLVAVPNTLMLAVGASLLGFILGLILSGFFELQEDFGIFLTNF